MFDKVNGFIKLSFPAFLNGGERFRSLVYGAEAPHPTRALAVTEVFPEEEEDSLELTMALHEGLKELTVPSITADFDDRVLYALRPPTSRWQALYQNARPLLPGAACSLLVTLLLIRATSGTLPSVESVKTPSATVAAAQSDKEARAILAQFDTMTMTPISRAEMLRAARRPAPVAPQREPASVPDASDRPNRRSQIDAGLMFA